MADFFEGYEVSEYDKNLHTKIIQKKNYHVQNPHGIHDWLEFEYNNQFGNLNSEFNDYFEFQDDIYCVTMLAID